MPAPSQDPARYLALAGAGGLVLLVAWGLVSEGGLSAFLDAHFAEPARSQAALEGSTRYTAAALLGYASLLALGLALLDALLLRRAGIALDRPFFIVLAPVLVAGPLFTALLDSGYFLDAARRPTWPSYLVIEPWVYVTTAALATIALLLAAYARKARPNAQRLVPLAALALLATAEYALFAFGPTYRLLPIVVYGCFALAATLFIGASRRAPGLAAGFSFGLLVLAMPVALAVAWLAAPFPPWAAPRSWSGNHFAALPVVVGAAVASAILVVALARTLARRFPSAAPAATATAGALVFAHALDAASTIVAIKDPLNWGLPGYGEQNPLSDALLSFAGGAPFFAVKLLLAAGVAIVLARETSELDPRVVRLLALAVFALGFGPGMRNLTRLVLGV